MALVALLALLLLVLWAAPGLLDWNRYRDDIAAHAAASLGRPVRIRGAVTLHLLPQPALTAAGIEVDDAGDGVALRADELRLRVALGPLLAGRIEARELVLRGADLRLPWPLPGGLRPAPPGWLNELQARVERSRVQLGSLALTGIDATLATDPDTGTVSAAGAAQTGTLPWRFTARLSRPGRDGTAGLDLSLDGDGRLRDTGGTFSGRIAGDGGLQGRVAGRGPDLSQLLPAPAVPWRGDGRLSAAADLAVADEVVLEVGGSPARGAVALRLLPEPRLDVALAAGRLDLDAWLAVLLRPMPGVPIPVGIDLSAEAAALNGGTLRRLRAAFDLDASGIAVRDAAALLPGDAQLSLAGRLAAALRFEGRVQLKAPDLRGTLRWVEPLVPALLAALPPDVLRSADLSAQAAADPGGVSLTELRGTLDGTGVGGALQVGLGARTSLVADLVVDRLPLDPWTPDALALRRAEGWRGLFERATAVDADLTVRAPAASWRGREAGPFLLDMHAEAGRLTLHRLETAPFGLSVAVSGVVNEAGRVADGRVELRTADAAPLRGVLPPGVPALSGPGSALLLLSGPPDALSARLSLDLMDLHLEAQPLLNLPAGRLSGPLMLHHPGTPRLLRLLDLPGWAAWLGEGSFSLVGQLAAAPGRAELQGFDVAAGTLRAKGTLSLEGGLLSGQVAAEALPLPFPPLRSRTPLPLPGLHGWQAAVRLDAAQVLLGAEPVLDGLSLDLDLRDSVLRLPRITARLGGGSLSAAAVLDAAASPPRVEVQAQVAGLSAPLPGEVGGGAIGLLSGQADMDLALSATGHSPAALLATIEGRIGLTVQDGVAAGFSLSDAAAALLLPDHAKATAAARTALLDGSTPFTRLDLPLLVHGGVLTADAALSSGDGTATLSGGIDLAGPTVDLRLVLHPILPEPGSAPELALRLAGPLDAPVRTPELAGLARWLAERADP